MTKNILIAGIIREKKTIIIPTGDDFIKPGDKVVVLATESRINNLTDVIEWG